MSIQAQLGALLRLGYADCVAGAILLSLLDRWIPWWALGWAFALFALRMLWLGAGKVWQGRPERARRVRSGLVNAGLAASAVLLTLGAVETVLSLGKPADFSGRFGGAYEHSEDPILGYRLRAGALGLVNEDGYLGPRVSVEKPPGTYRIVGLGDSITMYGSDDGTGYLSVLGEGLRALPGAPSVEVLNFGVGGWGTRQEVHDFNRRGLRYQPDLVTVGFCLNDVMEFGFAVNALTGKVVVDDPLSEEPEVMSRLSRLLSVKRSGVPIEDFFRKRVFRSYLWTQTVQALERLAKLSEAHGFRVLVIIFPLLTDLDHYLFTPAHAALRQEAERLGFGVLDLLPVFAPYPAEDLRSSPDDLVHPNALGYRLSAEAIVARIRTKGLLPSTETSPNP